MFQLVEDPVDCLLCCMMLDGSVIDEVDLSPSMFPAKVDRHLFVAIRDTYAETGSVDAGDIARRLERSGNFDRNRLAEVLGATTHTTHAATYARHIRTTATTSRIRATLESLLRNAEHRDPDELLDDAERQILDIRDRLQSNANGGREVADILVDALRIIETRRDSPGQSGLSTGFADLDEMLCGFHPSELGVLAARPSMGKTALALNFADRIASRGHHVLVYALEQRDTELSERLLAMNARVNSHGMRSGHLSDDEMHRIALAAESVAGHPLVVNDNFGITVGQIAAECRRRKRRSGLDLLMVDYVGLVTARDRTMPREQQVAEISRSFKGLAKELDIPVLLLSQLNRGCELREDKKPRLSDLRESGSIEQDADTVIFLHRPEMYDADDNPGLAEVIVRKNRHGPVGTVNLTYRKEFMRFDDWSAGTEYSGNL